MALILRDIISDVAIILAGKYRLVSKTTATIMFGPVDRLTIGHGSLCALQQRTVSSTGFAPLPL
jgi:hypothetical protein